MFVDSLTLADFRTYESLELSFEPGLTVLVGPNGVGKTNVVEAIDWAANLVSHRVSGERPLLRAGSDRAIVRLRVCRGSHRSTLEFELNAARGNRVRLNRAAPVRAREAVGILHTVLFSPEDLALVKGEPGHRRRFLDELATSMRPVLAAARSDYDRALKQRNALLKAARSSRRFDETDRATLAVWNDQLARAGAAVIGARLQLLEALEPEVDRAYQQLTDGPKHVVLSYECSALPPNADTSTLTSFSVQDLYELLLDAFDRVHRQERERGLTLVGPHRDDLVVSLGGTPVKGYASHGESWSTALALRLGSWYVHLADDPSPGAAPVLILDDVFAELDASRRARLAGLVRDAEQVFVTAAVDEDLPTELRDQPHRVLRVAPGLVVDDAAAAPSEPPVPADAPSPVNTSTPANTLTPANTSTPASTPARTDETRTDETRTPGTTVSSEEVDSDES